jgi:hypothetical protein
LLIFVDHIIGSQASYAQDLIVDSNDSSEINNRG